MVIRQIRKFSPRQSFPLYGISQFNILQALERRILLLTLNLGLRPRSRVITMISYSCWWYNYNVISIAQNQRNQSATYVNLYTGSYDLPNLHKEILLVQQYEHSTKTN